MLIVLKLPVFYLCAVVWWAIRAEPRPLEGALALEPAGGDGPGGCDWRDRRGRRSPRGGRGRYLGARRVALGVRARQVAA